MTWTRVQYKTQGRVQADAENSSRWSDATVDALFAMVYDQGWRRLLNADAAYRYTKLTVTPDTDGNVSLASIDLELLPERRYRVLSRETVRRRQLQTYPDAFVSPIWNPVVVGDVVRFPPGAGPVPLWVNHMPPNPERWPVFWGDVNADGEVTAADATAIAAYAVAGTASNLDAMLQRGDVTNTGGVTITDAQQVTLYLTGAMTSAAAGYARLVTERVISGVLEYADVADARAVEWPEGYENVLAFHLAAMLLTKGPVQAADSAALFAVVDSLYTDMIQALMDRSTQHQQIIPTDDCAMWGGGMNW